MIFGGGTFGKRLDHGSGDFMNGISTIMKGTPESSLLALPLCEVTARSGLGLSLDTESVGATILDYLAS